MRRSFPFASAVVLLFSALTILPASAADEWVVRESSAGVGDTVERLREAIERSGSSVLAVFDHSAAASDVGLEIPPSTVVLFAKPKTAAPLIVENPRAAMDMPQKILVWEENGSTYAGFVTPMAFVNRHGFEPGHPELRRLHAALNSLVSAAVKRPDERADAGH